MFTEQYLKTMLETAKEMKVEHLAIVCITAVALFAIKKGKDAVCE